MNKTASVLGRKAMAAISAVEGLALSNAAKRRQMDADQLGLTHAQRHAAIAEAYRSAAK